jgi:hypothetical protein
MDETEEEIQKKLDKVLKEKSFIAVRLLLKDELLETLDTQSALIGTGIKARELKATYRRLKKRNNDNTHLDKINNQNK